MTKHKPVLLKEVIEAFETQPREPVKILDGTFGRGGHTQALLNKFPNLFITAFDKDPAAVEHANKISDNRIKIINDDFKNLKNYRLDLFDGALFDLGVSSPQFDDPARGFSFQHDGPLDMRMDLKQKLTAKEIINTFSERELLNIFSQYGEIKRPARVVRAIVHDRENKEFTTTKELAGLIGRIDKHRGRIHPATQYFMALRIAVNNELEGLGEFIEGLPMYMEPGSRLCVISFHSLEDRIIKNTFKKMHNNLGKIINKKVIVASRAEQLDNPRSRSAKLRIFEMGGHR
ncbi:MAG: 16S rRNA (cytosine(1402)-N(4))-methyltransferase RsmH [Oligoflexia bacterium]|nr:16S rRNA (cytosine(1402)-N(4))-methyltransferase RsmH [Oligoflexia bacterium]